MKYLINGGNSLSGSITVNSAKNAVLVQLASTVLVEGVTVINNVDAIQDVLVMIDILSSLGCIVCWQGNAVTIDSTNITNVAIARHLANKMRGSIFLIGALLGRMKQAVTYMPGGCAIGSRPIDIHLDVLKSMGVDMDILEDQLICHANRLVGCDITLRMPSVGATENAIMCAVLAEGVTTLHGCAIEPEVVALQQSLISMGADIEGVGSADVTIRGVKRLYNATIDPIPDRIVTATYLVAGCMTRGDITLNNVVPQHIECLLEVLSGSGVKIYCHDHSIRVISGGYGGLGNIVTKPYPYFATDMQSLVLSMATVAKGDTSITETMFENRLVSNCRQLVNMGANIEQYGNMAIVHGADTLYGGTVYCTDLRGGAGLVLAGLVAKGTTIVHDIHHINRGYINLGQALVHLGADLHIIS